MQRISSTSMQLCCIDSDMDSLSSLVVLDGLEPHLWSKSMVAERISSWTGLSEFGLLFHSKNRTSWRSHF